MVVMVRNARVERDYNVGVLYLLKLSGNQILYKNIIAQIALPATML